MKDKKCVHKFSETIWREQSTWNAYCRCRLEDNIKINVIYIYIYITDGGISFKFNFLCLKKPLIRMYINPYHLCFPKHKESNLVIG